MNVQSFPSAIFGAVVILLLTSCAPAELRPPVLPEMSTAELEAQAAIDLDLQRKQYLGEYPDVELPEVDLTVWAVSG